MTTRLAQSDFSIALDDAILERRSIRAFRPDPVERSIIEEVLRLVVWSPSPHNSQPWRFTALFEWEDKKQLADAMARRLAEELCAAGLPADAIVRQTHRSQHRITHAPVALLCSLVSDGLVAYSDQRQNNLEWQMAVQSVGAALQTLFLASDARGLGTCWMAAPMYCPDVVRDVLSLPEAFVPQALVLMGYPDTPGKSRERRSFDDMVEFR